MNNYLNVHVIVEGQTELTFIKSVLAPYLSSKGIFITPTLVSKKGAKGGDVKFERVQNDIYNALRNPIINIISTKSSFYNELY